MIKELSETKEIVFFCDIHGHNRKHGIFIYGCNNDENPRKQNSERVFPYLLSKNVPDLFFFKRCQYRIQKEKEGTGRVTKIGLILDLDICFQKIECY